jgi:hypothetical protein
MIGLPVLGSEKLVVDGSCRRIHQAGKTFSELFDLHEGSRRYAGYFVYISS